jgi:ubiquinone/menaquinone biosynthesis C-methylase UbiE
VISSELLTIVACPVCLEPAGCDACGLGAPDHAACESRYATRAGCACGGPDKVRLQVQDGQLHCPCCGGRYAIETDRGFLDLVPVAQLGDVTQYADHEFHDRLRVVDAPPVLSAGIKAGMMRDMLGLATGEAVLDLGCGAGKFALFSLGCGARPVGVDIAPFFLPRAVRTVDLVRADLRRLPFRKGVFPAAYSVDVLEHLDEPGVVEILIEARRVLSKTGRLFVYTHAMESSRIALFQRGVNRLARGLGALGLVDQERERMRKADHRNAIRSHEHFEALCARSGMRVARRRYYNVVFKAVIEDLGVRLFEQATRKPTRAAEAAAPAAVPQPSVERPRGGLLRLAQALTALLWLDVYLFGRVRTGPFFGLLQPTEDGKQGSRSS